MDIDIKELIKAAAEGFNLKDFKGDVVGVKVVENEIGNVEKGGIGVQKVYTTNHSKTTKLKNKVENRPTNKAMTLKYYTHGNNGVLMKQRKRVHQVYNMWNRWGWIDEQTSIDDFDAFFEGEPKHCNITWRANSTILTILLQELLKQTYIERKTGCAAKSLVEQQFGKTANSDRTRLDNNSEKRIKLTLLVLDPQNHDLIFQSSDNLSGRQDIQDAALQEIFAGHLRSTKGI